jgi:hypothetical protein
MIKLSNKNTLIILASLIIVISVVLIYLQRTASKPKSYASVINQVQTQSESDDVNAIEKDLLDTDFEDLDKELLEIEKELDSQY